MIHTWDQQLVRLRHRVEELEEQNERLRDLLKDAVRIYDEEMATGHRPAAPSRFANMYRCLLFHSVSLRYDCNSRGSRLMLTMRQLPLPYRRDISPAVGWPFEPVVNRRDHQIGLGDLNHQDADFGSVVAFLVLDGGDLGELVPMLASRCTYSDLVLGGGPLPTSQSKPWLTSTRTVLLRSVMKKETLPNATLMMPDRNERRMSPQTLRSSLVNF